MHTIRSFVSGSWHAASDGFETVFDPATEEPIAQVSSVGIDFAGALDHGRRAGAALREMTYAARGEALIAASKALHACRDELLELSMRDSGVTRKDAKFDIDGATGTLSYYGYLGRELGDRKIRFDGEGLALGRSAKFWGRHAWVPRPGVAVHINAFNFPVWGMLEKLAPCFLAGVPAIIKPATATSYVTEACFRMIVESGILPHGSVQLVAGQTGNLLELMGTQDVVSFTGSAHTAEQLRTIPNLIRNSTRFFAEQDSLNAAVLGLDSGPGTPEFDLFAAEVVKEMTTKAGQKCTAIRRIIVPRPFEEALAETIIGKLTQVKIGHPASDTSDMGALVSLSQRRDVLDKVDGFSGCTERLFGNPDAFDVEGADASKGAFMPPLLLRCAKPHEAEIIHAEEAFGPVSTLMPYDDVEDAIAIAHKGQGSLVCSVFTHDKGFASAFCFGAASYHGRMLFVDRENGSTHSGHGSPLPHLIHGGPGRAGGSEEMGGIRGVKHYMQRTAIQAGPDMLASIVGHWHKGAQEISGGDHPFRLHFDELEIGKSLHSAERTITLDDIEHFAEFTGDTFYAHMDEEAAAANPFFPGRVAHGYLLLSFAAGLFVDPDPGPVLANYGLDNLRFVKPVSPGDTIKVRLTAKDKVQRNPAYGEVRWDVEITNQEGEPVAQYDLLTMNAMKDQST